MSVLDLIAVVVGAICGPVVLAVIVMIIDNCLLQRRINRRIGALEATDIAENHYKANRLEIALLNANSNGVYGMDNRVLRQVSKHCKNYDAYDIESAAYACVMVSQNKKAKPSIEQLDAVTLINDAHGRSMPVDDEREWRKVMCHAVAHPEDASRIVDLVQRGITDYSRIIASLESLDNGVPNILIEGAL